MQKHTIAVLGGTGAEGGGLALRWARAGHRVLIGSRSKERAQAAASELNALLAKWDVAPVIEGEANPAAATVADVVVLTVPYAAQAATVTEVKDQLAGKVLVDATVPLAPPKVSVVQLPAGGSAVAAVQALLGEGVKVVSAFQSVSAHHLRELDHEIDCDVLVCGNDVAARETVVALVADLGLRGIHAGTIANSAATEALTSVLIAINRRYKVPSAGIRITGLPAGE